MFDHMHDACEAEITKLENQLRDCRATAKSRKTKKNEARASARDNALGIEALKEQLKESEIYRRNAIWEAKFYRNVLEEIAQDTPLSNNNNMVNLRIRDQLLAKRALFSKQEKE